MLDSDEVIPLRDLEKAAILNCLKRTGVNKQLAAGLLGIGITTLYRKLKEYQDAHDDEVASEPS